MLVVIAVAVAGCSTQTPSTTSGDLGKTPTATTAGVAPAQAAGSTAPATGSVVTGANIFGTGASYNWIEYKMVSSGMTAYMKFEKTGKCTMRMEGKDLPGGSMTIDCSSKGQTSTQPGQSNPADVKSDVKFTLVGIEPVSVGAGTYPAATKYLVTSEGQKIYYWTAAGVPTFVKMQSPSSDGDVIMELNGWG